MRQQTLRASLAMMFLFVAVVGCSHEPSDAQLASEVQNKINGDSNISEKLITVSANGGIITLAGKTATDLERTTAANEPHRLKV